MPVSIPPTILELLASHSITCSLFVKLPEALFLIMWIILFLFWPVLTFKEFFRSIHWLRVAKFLSKTCPVEITWSDLALQPTSSENHCDASSNKQHTICPIVQRPWSIIVWIKTLVEIQISTKYCYLAVQYQAYHSSIADVFHS